MESYAHENGNDIVSFVDIGEAVPEHMKPGLEPVWLDLEPTMYWMVKEANGVKFTDDSSETSYGWMKNGQQSYHAIFDSGTSLTMIPESLF